MTVDLSKIGKILDELSAKETLDYLKDPDAYVRRKCMGPKNKKMVWFRYKRFSDKKTMLVFLANEFLKMSSRLVKLKLRFHRWLERLS